MPELGPENETVGQAGALPLERATAQEQEMKRTRKKHNAVIKAKGWWRRSGGPDDRRIVE